MLLGKRSKKLGKRSKKLGKRSNKNRKALITKTENRVQTLLNTLNNVLSWEIEISCIFREEIVPPFFLFFIVSFR